MKKSYLSIKDCDCRLVGIFKKRWKICDFHKECIGDPCATAINTCDNPKHRDFCEHCKVCIYEPSICAKLDKYVDCVYLND